MASSSYLERIPSKSALAGRGRLSPQRGMPFRPTKPRRYRPCLEVLEDRTVPSSFPTPLLPVQPSGGLIYDGSVDGGIAAPSATDTYTLNLDSDQTVALVAHPRAPGLRPTVTLSANHRLLAAAT